MSLKIESKSLGLLFVLIFFFLSILLNSSFVAADCGGGAYCNGSPVTPDPSPSGTTVCGNGHTPFTCVGDDWVAGSGTCYDASRCPAPVNGVCSNAHYNCIAGNPTGQVAPSPNYFFYWICDGLNGGTDAQCTEGVIAGQCGSTHNNCIQGVPWDENDTETAYKWACDSPNSSGGGFLTHCSENKPVPIYGSCGSTHYNCSSGTSASPSSNATDWTWTCQGANGGTTASCSENKVPVVNGSCGYPHNNCNAGTTGSTNEDGDFYFWYCNGSNGGYDVTCVETKTHNGVCDTAHYGCLEGGVSVLNEDNPTNWEWVCYGRSPGRGSDANCAENKPVNCSGYWGSCVNGTQTYTVTTPASNGGNSCPYVNGTVWGCGTAGSCSSVHYACVSGNSANNSSNTSNWTWNCNSGNGGSNASCSENKPPANSPSGTISATTCTIPNGASTCVSAVTWSTSNLVAGTSTAVTRNNPDGTTVSTNTSGTNVSNTVNHGQSSFYLYNNGVALASTSINSECATGNTWNGSVCATTTYTVTGVAGSNGTISPASRTVNEGATTTFTITPSSGYIAGASGCGGSLSGTTYTTGAITSDCTVSASFSTTPLPNLTVPSGPTPVVASTSAAQTFTGTVYNTGSAGTGTSFSNFWQRATASAGSGTITDLAASTMSALAAGATANSTVSITFTSAGVYSVRVCTDKSSSGSAGTINESNEGDNCSPWRDVTVSGDSVINGTCDTVHYSCLAGTSVNNVSGSTSYTWTCNGINGGTNASCSEPKGGSCDAGYTGTPPNCCLYPTVWNGTACSTGGSCATGFYGTPPNCVNKKPRTIEG